MVVYSCKKCGELNYLDLILKNCSFPSEPVGYGDETAPLRLGNGNRQKLKNHRRLIHVPKRLNPLQDTICHIQRDYNIIKTCIKDITNFVNLTSREETPRDSTGTWT